jgi:uncharacterized protein (TIGR01777 family)
MERMRILLAGASGFLGTRLVARLRDSGHEAIRLVRRPVREPDEIRWDPAAGQLDASALSTVDAVVNLAGAGVGDKRWTDQYKKTLVDSRVDATATLVRAMRGVTDGPKVLLNSSAVGFYGETGDRAVDEQSPPGEGFLPDLCQAWEAATEPARDAGTRVLQLRTGFPLARDGGLLKPLLLQFRLFAGGKLGNGRQYVPWISLPDWLGAVEFLLARDDIAGPVNLTGPQPVPNAEFSAALARALHRPALFAVPGFALRLAVGEFGGEALVGQRVLPGVLAKHGFGFAQRTIDEALAAALGGLPY